MWWFQQGLCVLPVLLVVWTAATFVFAYITAVELGHVDPFVPYISDTGTVPPERCVFGVMLSVSAFLGIATMYVRYKQVEALTDQGEKQLLKLNTLGLVLGCISSFGMCVVANFQKTTLFSMHLVGAMLTFGVGALYILTHTLVSYRMQPHIHTKRVFWVRLIIGLWTFSSIISSILTIHHHNHHFHLFVSSVILYSSLPGLEVNKKLHWNPGEPGYTAHMVSTVSEWSLAFSFISFFLTYIRDFQINLRAEADLQSSNLHDSSHFGSTWIPGETSPLLAGSI
ncbi:DNA damage-regulated autophagy modulator protein 2-like isoform X2 [Neoarius graeffei]|uniref:DNA damage-regulated autophagy modulator protein 2-like isoform X2 n=1 Tax=Neoarius graeffei TaxID=443677 RepID=UPI00298C0E58|nr:DNA damage-regulated autophagy modulator protein 2-like isoform X2 [Neoarius graeffei]